MSEGGTVHGNWIECPFHHWRWDEYGLLREIPYSTKPIRQPEAPPCPRWEVWEAEGDIMLRENRLA